MQLLVYYWTYYCLEIEYRLKCLTVFLIKNVFKCILLIEFKINPWTQLYIVFYWNTHTHTNIERIGAKRLQCAVKVDEIISTRNETNWYVCNSILYIVNLTSLQCRRLPQLWHGQYMTWFGNNALKINYYFDILCLIVVANRYLWKL